MSELEFIAALVRALAWPGVVLVVVLMFRLQLAKLLARPLRSLRAGALELNWDLRAAELQTELDDSPNSGQEGPSGATADLASLAAATPVAAVLQAFGRIEDRLRELLVDQPGPGSAVQLARRAANLDLISPEAVKAVEGAAVLRNLAAHGESTDLDEARAQDYLALVDAVLFALSRPPRPHNG